MLSANFLSRRRLVPKWPTLIGCLAFGVAWPAFAEDPVLRVNLSHSDPRVSHAIIRDSDGHHHKCRVGSGAKGIKRAGARFEDGWSLLGRFRINAMLSASRFEMDARLIAESDRGEAYLREHLFANMSRIDFDGDGAGNEYGVGFIGLRPENGTAQPFQFGEYRGVYRWYSYAVHGTSDEARVGRRSTGGCINFTADDLRLLMESLHLGDLVEITAIP